MGGTQRDSHPWRQLPTVEVVDGTAEPNQLHLGSGSLADPAGYPPDCFEAPTEGTIMTTIAIIGAGPGLGQATARRFGREGFSVALISRNQANVDPLAAELAADGITARGYAANARDPQALRTALDAAAADLGPIEVLQYSPVPAKEFMKPVLETTAEDLLGPVEQSVYGPVAACTAGLPGFRTLGRGTILFINGGSAVTPNGNVTGTSVAFAAERLRATAPRRPRAGGDPCRAADHPAGHRRRRPGPRARRTG